MNEAQLIVLWNRLAIAREKGKLDFEEFKRIVEEVERLFEEDIK